MDELSANKAAAENKSLARGVAYSDETGESGRYWTVAADSGSTM